jgi:hypothetical protein
VSLNAIKSEGSAFWVELEVAGATVMMLVRLEIRTYSSITALSSSLRSALSFSSRASVASFICCVMTASWSLYLRTSLATAGSRRVVSHHTMMLIEIRLEDVKILVQLFRHL